VASIGVVLGAGGIVGGAYHAGVLTALAEAGHDARTAQVIVGTSAGAGVAAIVRAGFPPLDLAPRSTGRPISDEAAAIVGATGAPPALDLRPRPFSRPPLPSSPGLLFGSGLNPLKALAGLLPTGTISADVIGERIAAIYGDAPWPEHALWICAVDLDTGSRVVFGRDRHDVPVGVAVQASSSIPGFFQPVVHRGTRYVDGGVHSPTNADLLEGYKLDLVVVVSPMSATRAGQGSTLPNVRPMYARRLRDEVEPVRASGAAVVTFQPTADDVAAMGRNPMDAGRRRTVTETALATTRTRLADPALAERLALWRS
jgi:NTE family protein